MLSADEKNSESGGLMKRKQERQHRCDVAVLPERTLPGERFPQPYTEEEMKENTVRYVPPRTRTNNNWATKVFTQWVTYRNYQPNVTKFPPDLLEKLYPINTLDKWLAAFILEARHADGEYYPGSTLKNILAALFRVMKENLGASNVITFLEKASQERYYPQLTSALDRQLRALRSNGIGLERKKAELITPYMEDVLWSSGVLGSHSPISL